MANKNNRTARPSVVIFGGGITGLTAAHELAERGFSVLVYEAEEDATESPDTAAVGGMARTQWRWLPQTSQDRLSERAFQRTYPIIRTPWRIYFRSGKSALPKDAGTLNKINDIKEFLAQHQEVKKLYIDAFAFNEGDDHAISESRAKAVFQALTRVGVNGGRLEQQALGNVLTDDRFLEPEERRYVSFSIDATMFAGEHGYRFFPSFYWHLFDTMKRTPIMIPIRRSDVETARIRAQAQASGVDILPTEKSHGVRFEETGFSAYDQLRSLPEHAIAKNDDRRPIVLPRQRITSMEELHKITTIFLRDLNFRSTDITIFNGKLLKFITSCSDRRETEYSRISWMEFIDSPHYSEVFRRTMDKWPYSLVALRARECDAYTHGVITIQLMLDQFRRGPTDFTLTGPTSISWLNPWKTYLERRHDVRFARGSLREIQLTPKKDRLGFRLESSGNENLDEIFGYCVLALPVERVASIFPQKVLDEVAEEVRRDAHIYGDSRNDIQLAVEMSRSLRGDQSPRGPDAFTAGSWNTQTPIGALRNFSGIQYYFEEDVNWVDGHTYYIDSPWGLSSIAQSVNWREKMSRRDLYRAIVSVEIGIFDAVGENNKTAWECSPHEIAEEVWRQVKKGAESKTFTLPDPAYYHIDDNLIFHGDQHEAGGIRRNKSPFLVPLKGTWNSRPGEPDDYRVYLNQIVIAGTYMKTYTRLTTMEAANESARHAVNAILKHRFGREGTTLGLLAETKSMTERELPDAQILKEIDQGLFEKGLPHFMDILKWNDWPAVPWHILQALLRRML